MQIIDKKLPLSPRVQEGLAYIEESRNNFKPVWNDAGSIVDEDTVKLPLVVRRSIAEKWVLTNMPLEIRDYELIVGSVLQGSNALRPKFPEYSTQEENERAWKKMIAAEAATFGHFEPSYPHILGLGIPGIRSKCCEKLVEAKLKNETEKVDWYEAVLVSLEGVDTYILRCRDLALEQAKTAEPVRKKELEEIAEVCQTLTERAPQTFREAIQLFWFGEVIVNSTSGYCPMGRFDQNLWPFLEADLERGAITLEEAQELVDLVWLKLNERLQRIDVVDKTKTNVSEFKSTDEFKAFWVSFFGVNLGGKSSEEQFRGNDGNYQQWFMNMALSGVTGDGKDATNPMTYIALNATYRLKLVQPELYVRLHKDSPEELIERTADLQGAALTNPTVFNDDSIIPALVDAGYPLEVAREYTSDGCWEAHPEGVTFFKYGMLSSIEMFDRMMRPDHWKNMETAFYSPEHDPFKDVELPDPHSYSSFEEIMDTFKMLLDRDVQYWLRSEAENCDGRLYEISPLPLLSAFEKGPLDTGKDLTALGMPYSQRSPVLGGLSHTADSLTVIKKLCFEDKTVSLTDLVDAVLDNWEGHEVLRQQVQKNVAAYGNDIDYADEMAKEIVDFFIDSLKRHTAEMDTDIIFPPSVATFENYTDLGNLTGATPDGRFSGEPVSSNASPSVGRAVNGVTAAMNSYLKLPHEKLGSAAPLDVAMMPKADLHERIVTLIKAFVEGKGGCLTVSVNDPGKMRAAQKEPDKYRDLKVRVGGWDAYFVDLPVEYQDWQIKKLEQYVS